MFTHLITRYFVYCILWNMNKILDVNKFLIYFFMSLRPLYVFNIYIKHYINFKLVIYRLYLGFVFPLKRMKNDRSTCSLAADAISRVSRSSILAEENDLKALRSAFLDSGTMGIDDNRCTSETRRSSTVSVSRRCRCVFSTRVPITMDRSRWPNLWIEQ